MPTRLRLSCRALLIIVLVRPDFYLACGPVLLCELTYRLCRNLLVLAVIMSVVGPTKVQYSELLFFYFSVVCWHYLHSGSVAEWLACWTQAQKDLGSNHSRNAVG